MTYLEFCPKKKEQNEVKKNRFSEEQIIGSLVKAVYAAHNISTATYHTWKRQYGGMEVSEARRLRGWRWTMDVSSASLLT